MFVAILKATNSSLQKGMTFRRSIYVKKVMHSYLNSPRILSLSNSVKLWDI